MKLKQRTNKSVDTSVVSSVKDTNGRAEKVTSVRRVISAAVILLTFCAIFSELILAIYMLLPGILLIGVSYYPAESMANDWMRVWLWAFPALMTTLLLTALHIAIVRSVAKFWKRELKILFLGHK